MPFVLGVGERMKMNGTRGWGIGEKGNRIPVRGRYL